MDYTVLHVIARIWALNSTFIHTPGVAGLQAFGAIEKTVQEETSAAGETVRLPRHTHTHTRGDSDTSEMVQKCVVFVVYA